METILHIQFGSLPDKMVNWPLNLEAARQLANKYDQLAETGGVETADELNEITGFGCTYTCTLCLEAKENRLSCVRCLFFNGNRTSCIRGKSSITYRKLIELPNPENLRDRASFIRSVINSFE